MLPSSQPSTPPGPLPQAHGRGLLSALDLHASVSIADAQGRIVYVNQRFTDISGYAPGELLGENHRRLQSGLHPRGFYDAMWRQLARGGAWQGELCNRHKSGALYWVAATIMPVAGDDGRPQLFVSLRTDITAAKAAARTHDTQARALAKLSHGLRTPLNTVLGYARTLLSDVTLTPPQAGQAAEIHAAGQQMLRLIERAEGAVRPASNATADQAPAPAVARPARVLCIEDDAANLRLVQSMLGLLPQLQVAAASTGRDGLALAQQERPDIVLLDIHLPDTSGLALLAELRALPGLDGTAIVAVSADAMPDHIDQALAAGFDDYLVKPFDMQKLFDCVQGHIVRHRT